MQAAASIAKSDSVEVRPRPESKTEKPTAKKTTKQEKPSFKTISEVADILGVETHVLRFWETKFKQIKPLKRRGGRRFYREEDIQTLQTIQQLLHVDGLTIKGAQKLLRAGKSSFKAQQQGSVTNIATAREKQVEKQAARAEPIFPVEKDGQLSLVVEEGKAGLSDEMRAELKKCLEDLQKIKKVLHA